MPDRITPTAEIIGGMSDHFGRAASQLGKLSIRMRNTNDLTYASEAMTIITNTLMACRLDLLVTRPIRTLLAEISDIQEEV